MGGIERIAIPALLVGVGAAVLAACNTTEPGQPAPAPVLTPFEELVASASDASYTDETTTRLVDMVQLSGRDLREAAGIIRAAGRATQADSTLLQLVRTGLTRGYSAPEFESISAAAASASYTDATTANIVEIAARMLHDPSRPNAAMQAVQMITASGWATQNDATLNQMVATGVDGRLSGSEFELVAAAAAEASYTDHTTLSLTQMAEYSSMSGAKAASVITAAGRATQNDASLLTLVNSQLTRPRPGEPGTSTGDDPV